jgi:hypothetical protein
MAGCCECGDEPSGSCATELVIAAHLAHVGPVTHCETSQLNN